jgi:hypothetical protein
MERFRPADSGSGSRGLGADGRGGRGPHAETLCLGEILGCVDIAAQTGPAAEEFHGS